jgi:hypoxanthine phosphoribosyltransferase
MNNDIKKVIISVEEINEICERIGAQISKDFEGKDPLFVGLLRGCNPFMSDLLRHVTIPCTLDYMKASSYQGTSSTGKLTVLNYIPHVKDRHVIIIDDILDSGRTLSTIKELLLENGAKTVNLCVLLDKPEGRVINIEADYYGTLVPNEFVVGYGLDYNDYYRNLPYIGVLKEEIYQK